MDRKQIFKNIEQFPAFDHYITTRLLNLYRDGTEASAPNIIAIAKGENSEASPAVQVRAHNHISRIALGGTKNRVLVLENREWLSIIMKATSEFLPDRDTMIRWMEVVFSALERRDNPEYKDQ